MDSANCTTKVYEVNVSKTATTAYTRTMEWDIHKSVAPANVSLFDGQATPVTYTVGVTSRRR